MPKQEGILSSSSKEKNSAKQEHQPIAESPEASTPESQEAQNFYVSAQKLLEKYHRTLAQYNKELAAPSAETAPGKIQKDLKAELQQLWDQLHDLMPAVKEHEYMVTDEGTKKKMIEVADEISDLPTYPGQDLEPREAKKSALNRDIDTVLKNRESAKEQAKEHLRNQERVKAMRKQLAKLKSSFAGSYKISTIDAAVLLPQIIALHKNQGAQKSSGGILGWVKNIAGAPDKSDSKFTNEEKTKYLALDLNKFKADLKDIQQKDKEFSTLWEQVQKAEKNKKFYFEEEKEVERDHWQAEKYKKIDFDEDIEPDDSVSFATLREGFNDDIRDAYKAGDSAKAMQLKQELDAAYENLRTYFPEILQERTKHKQPAEKATILPTAPASTEYSSIEPKSQKTPEISYSDDFSDTEVTTPTQATREFESAATLKTQKTADLETESAVTLKTEKTAELESAITLKTEKTKQTEAETEEAERRTKIEAVINSFGGDEKGRTKAAQMWDDAFVKLSMVERSGILKPNQKIGNAMDYVYANATIQMKATEMERLMAEAEQKIINNNIEAFGGGKAGQAKAAEIWDLANQMMGKESSEAEVQRQFGFTRMEYVEAWADLSKAYIDKNEDKIQAMELRVFNLTKKLLGEAGNKLSLQEFRSNWNLLAGSGASRMNKMRGLGQNRARKEAGVQTKKISGLEPAQPIIEGSRSIEHHNDHEAFSVDWTMNLLPTAEIKWKNFVDTFFAKSKTKGEKEAMLIVINDEIETLVEKLQAMSNISEEYQQLDKILKITAGDPPEATRYVMLKVFTDGAFIGTETNDAKAKKAVSDTIKKIDKRLTYLSQEAKKKPTLRQSKKLPDTLKDEAPPTLKDEAPPTLQDEAPPTLREEDIPTLKDKPLTLKAKKTATIKNKPKTLREPKKPVSKKTIRTSTMRKA